jgi:Asp-tRNA(Asn)/Glu-tRNA(Gln) amidotransferase A subunit family amidase
MAQPGDGAAARLPVGLQVLAPQFAERTALRVARAYEAASGVQAEVAPVA